MWALGWAVALGLFLLTEGPNRRAEGSVPAPPGQAGNRSSAARFALNLNLVLYQFDEAHSSKIESEVRLSQTFDSLEAERGFIQRSFSLEDLLARHVRSVGLETGETFRDGVGMGEEPFFLLIRAVRIGEFSAAIDLNATYGAAVVLDVRNVKFENYETALLKGSAGRFGVRVYQGPHSKESVPAQRTLLVSATAVIVPPSKIQNRPYEISHPCDEFGGELKIQPGDVFIPPAVIEAYVPRFTARRAFNATVLVEGVISSNGVPTNPRVIRTFDAGFNNAAIDAFRQFRFRPATLNGKPIYATLRADITLAGNP